MINIVVNARHMESSDALREYIEPKLMKLPRYYDRIQGAEVILDIEADTPTCEIIVQASRKATFIAKVREQDLYVGFDQCLHKITEQIRRHKDKVRDRQGTPHSEALES